LLACGDDEVVADGVDLEARCDQDGPVKLLDLAPGEAVGIVQPFDVEAERIRIETFAVSDDASPDPPDALRHVVMSACGEDPEDVAVELRNVFVWEGALLGTDRACNLVQPEHLQDRSPRVLAERGCASWWSSVGRVSYDAASGSDVGRLVVIRSTGSGRVEVDTLADDVLVPHPEAAFSPYKVADDEFAIHLPSLDVETVDARTGARNTVVEGAIEFDVSSQYVLYAPFDAVIDGKAPMVLRARDGESETVIAESFPLGVTNLLTDHVVVLRYIDPAPRLWFWTRDGRPIEPPDDYAIGWVLEDESIWLHRADDSGEVTFARWREGESPEVLMSCRECTGDYNGWVHGMQIERGPWYPSTRELWFVGDGDAQAQLLASAVGKWFLQLPDRRVLTSLEDDDEIGPFVLHDYRDGSARTIHPRVRESATFLTSVFNREREILYEIAEPAGEHALYHARLAAGDE
jgi:hypothetical protein